MFSFRAFFQKIRLNTLLKAKPKHFSRIFKATGIALLLGLTTSVAKLDNNNKSLGPKGYNTIEVCDSATIKQGKIHQVDMANGRKIVIVRYKGKLHAVGGECTFDNTSLLAEGVCFGDKLFCCHHGCAFDIETGRVELPPAINNLPRFFVQQKSGKVILHTPPRLPIAVQPLAQGRDFTDTRKIVIVGNGMGTLGCIQGLRQNGYSGEIQVITQQSQLPYNDQVLMNSFTNKNQNSDKMSQNHYPRSQKWYRDLGIDFIFNQQVLDIDGKEHYPFLVIQNETKIQYDGLVLDLGVDYRGKRIQGLSRGQNTFILNRKNDYDDLSKRLRRKDIKDLVVMGYNPKSMKFIKTIRQQYPDINITVVDPNEKNKIEQRLGPELALLLVEDDAKHGVRFYLKLPIQRVEKTSSNRMKLKMNLDQEIDTDAIVMFPNNQIGRALYFQNSKKVQLDMSSFGTIKTDKNCRTSNRQIFGVGKGTAVHFFFGEGELPCHNNRIAYQQGYTAAYNILGLNIPYHMVPFETISSIGKQVKLVGNNYLYDEIYLMGNIEKWDFVVLYGLTGFIVGCATSPSQKRVAGIFQQAFRQQQLPNIKQFKQGKWNIQKLQTNIRKNKKAGCYKDPIDQIRENYRINPRDILWMHRDMQGAGLRVADELAKKPSFTDKDGFVRQSNR